MGVSAFVLNGLRLQLLSELVPTLWFGCEEGDRPFRLNAYGVREIGPQR